MAQPSIASYFNTRKRSAVEDLKVSSARKVLILGKDNVDSAVTCITSEKIASKQNNNITKLEGHELQHSKVVTRINFTDSNTAVPQMARKVGTRRNSRTKKPKDTLNNNRDIQQFFSDMTKKNKTETIIESVIPSGDFCCTLPEEKYETPPSTPTKSINAMDNLNLHGKEPTLIELKKKLSRSARLAELKVSMTRFKQCVSKLEEAEKKTAKVADSPTLKTFKAIEVEVLLSPQKVQSPEKAYLSPRKETTARKNLFNIGTPVKTSHSVLSSPSKQPLNVASKLALTLPYKYRCLAEFFRAIDTVSQILFNRKETITFRKLKPAVEEMVKRNLLEKHLAQIKYIYSEAFSFSQEKLKVFGAGIRKEQWELVITPQIPQETMTSDILLERRRKLFNKLIEKLKDYHNEFLLSLDPPIEIPREKLTRWHPEFDIERVPDIEVLSLPQAPAESVLTSGKDVLERARVMFNCNTRMERALEKLKEREEQNSKVPEEKPQEITSVLKGIPKALLEKVRQKQAAKALEKMTRTATKDKEVQIYSRLPEIARLTRNLFVAEKKSVLPVESVVDKLSNSYRTFLTKSELEDHLKIICKEITGWLVFHEIRNNVFVKISKNADLSQVLRKLETLSKQKLEP